MIAEPLLNAFQGAAALLPATPPTFMRPGLNIIAKVLLYLEKKGMLQPRFKIPVAPGMTVGERGYSPLPCTIRKKKPCYRSPAGTFLPTGHDAGTISGNPTNFNRMAVFFYTLHYLEAV